MQRRSLFVWCAAFVSRLWAQPPQGEPLPVLIDIGAKKAVTLTLRGMERAQMIEIIATFLSKTEYQNARLNTILGQAGIVTLILTTGRERVTPAP